MVETKLISIRDDALESVTGAVEMHTDDNGAVAFYRASASARSRLADSGVGYHSSCTSGVRLEAITDALTVELEVALTQMVAAGTPSPESTFDLVVDGRFVDRVHTTEQALREVDLTTGAVQHTPHPPTRLRFDLGSQEGERHIEIWFPHKTSVALIDARVPEGSTFRPAAPTGPVWLHHGSSIGQGIGAEHPTGTWPAIVARTTGESLINLSLGGECHLDQFMARTIRDLPVDRITLEFGINVINLDSMRERAFVSAFHGFIDTVRDGHPDTPITVISPIVCPAAEDHPGPTRYRPEFVAETVPRPADLAQGALTLTRIRTLLTEHIDLRCTEGDENLHYLDGLQLLNLRDVDVLPDGLHPNGEGYQRMADRFLALRKRS